MDFQELKRQRFQQVPVDPFCKRTTELIYSDCVAHLPVIQYYASLCQSVMEFGVRDGHSTVALINGCKGTVVSVDINRTAIVDALENTLLPCSRWKFIQADTSKPIDDVDAVDVNLIMYDTLHTYDHLKAELAEHGRKAWSYIVFHDTETCGLTDASGPNPKSIGILPAIEEFLALYPGEYKTVYRTSENNGLWVLERLSVPTESE